MLPASTASTLERHHALSPSSDILSPPERTDTSGGETEFFKKYLTGPNPQFVYYELRT